MPQTFFAIFCANFCILQIFSQTFAQKKAQIFYGSYMPVQGEEIHQDLPHICSPLQDR